MGVRFTRRWVIGALVGRCWWSAASRARSPCAPPRRARTGRTARRRRSTLEFAPATWPPSSRKPLSRWLPVSGTMQPVRQATVKAKVSGDVRQITVREGDAVQAGQMLVRVDTADLDAQLHRAPGRSSQSRARRSWRSPRRRTR